MDHSYVIWFRLKQDKKRNAGIFFLNAAGNQCFCIVSYGTIEHVTNSLLFTVCTLFSHMYIALPSSNKETLEFQEA